MTHSNAVIGKRKREFVFVFSVRTEMTQIPHHLVTFEPKIIKEYQPE